MAQPPQKKPPKPNKAQDDSGLDSYFDEFFRNAEPPQLDETPEPDQQRQWISDQLMWETTLGMREDETIKRVITPGDDSDTDITQSRQSAVPKRVFSEQERQLLRTQVTEPAESPNSSANIPESANNPPMQKAKLPQPLPSSARKPQPDRQKRGAPATTVSRQSTSQSSGKPTVASSKAPVKPVPQSRPQIRPTAKAGSRASQQARPAAKSSSTVHQAGHKKAPTQRVTTHTQPAPKTQVRPAAPKQHPHTQTQPAMRESDLGVEEHIDFDIADEAVREKYFNLGKKIAAVLSIAIVSFICGYYIAGSNTTETPVSQKDIDTALAKMEQTITKKTKQPESKKSTPKKTKPKPAPINQTSEPAPAATGSGLTSDTPSGTTTVFEGKDIDIQQFDQTANTPEYTSNPYNELNEGSASSGTASFLPTPQGGEPAGVIGAPGTVTDPMTTAMAITDEATTNLTPEDDLQYLLDQSLQAFENEQWQLLIELSNQILVKDPSVVTALTNRAAANTELGFYVQALADCNLAIKLDPNNPLAINNRGYVFEKIGDSQNAIADYQKACEFGIEVSCKEAQRLKSTVPE
ncbi:hypothetical protein [Kaarinaea lacus]